jgi:hypothetical protein
MPYAGALIGFLAGLFVALVLGLTMAARPDAVSYTRAVALLPILALFGLLYDVLRARWPGVWRSVHPDRIWMSWLFKTTVYWTIVFPVARLLQDLAAAWVMRLQMPDQMVGGLFAHLVEVPALVGFLVAQAMFGTAFGILFTFLYRRLARRSPEAVSRRS